MADWLEITVRTVTNNDAEAAAEVLQLFALGDEGVAVEQVGDPNNLDPKALLPETFVKLYIDVERDSAEIRSAIQKALHVQSLPKPTFQLLKNEDWANAWKEHFQPFRIGSRFWIRPSWINSPPPNKDDIVLNLDPGMAFGTGTHETTQLCTQLIEEYVNPGQSLLDVGTGSGILSIVAAKLGATPILAFDNDILAVEATRKNATDNNITSGLVVREATVAQIESSQWDVVVVNILAVIIKKLLTEEGLMSYVKPDGVIIFSGILDVQLAEMQVAITEVGGNIVATRQLNDWIALVVRRTR